MKICDKCGCETDNLVVLAKSFNSMEVCGSCVKRLGVHILKVEKRIAAIESRAKQRAFKAWLVEETIPIRARKAYDMFRSLFHMIDASR